MTESVTVYFDAPPVIYRVERRHPWFERVQRATDEIVGARFVASELTRLECKVQPVRDGNNQLVALYELYFANIELLPMTRAVFERATALRATHNLKTPDALHLACAIEHGCDEFWTNDARLASGAPPGLVVRAFADAVDAPAVPADT